MESWVRYDLATRSQQPAAVTAASSTDQRPSASMIAWASPCGASLGTLWPMPVKALCNRRLAELALQFVVCSGSAQPKVAPLSLEGANRHHCPMALSAGPWCDRFCVPLA